MDIPDLMRTRLEQTLSHSIENNFIKAKRKIEDTPKMNQTYNQLLAENKELANGYLVKEFVKEFNTSTARLMKDVQHVIFSFDHTNPDIYLDLY